MKIQRISDYAFNEVNKLGTKHEPFHVKLDRLLVERKKAVRTTEPKPEAPPLGAYFKAAYKTAFGLDYPSWGPRENSQIKNWAKSLNEKQAKWCIDHYMAWNSPRAVKSGHSLGILVTSHVELVTDFKRAHDKQARLNQNKKARKEVDDELWVRDVFSDQKPNRGNAKQVPHTTQKRVPTRASVLPIEEKPFDIPSGFDIE